MPVLQNFSIGTQGKAGNLCWAVVGIGIATYFDTLAGESARWSQLCQFVTDVFSAHDGTSPDDLRCCEGQRILGADCNQTFWLPDALDITKNHGSVTDGSITFDQIKNEINNNRCPVGVEIEFPSGNNHVIAVFGYDETRGQRVVVGDPAPDASTNALVLYDELKNDYRQSGGQWRQTYRTVPTQG